MKLRTGKHFLQNRFNLKIKFDFRFWGQDLVKKKGDALNLIKRFIEILSIQRFSVVMVLENDQQNQVNVLKKELREGVGTDLSKWRFIFLP